MGKVLKILMPVEWVLLAFGVLTIVLYRSFGLQLPGQPGQGAKHGPFLFYLKQFITCLDLYALVLLCFVAAQVLQAIRRNSWSVAGIAWGPFWKGVSERFFLGQIFQDVRFFQSLIVMFVEFALLKNLIPHVNSSLYDEFFIASDKLVCGGRVCSELLLDVWGPGLLEPISRHYFWYYPYMSITAFIFIAAASRRLAQEYLCAFVSLFLFGVLWIYAVPTLGPVFVKPELYSFMAGGDIAGLQRELWEMHQALRANPSSGEGVFMISGFPSLHVAVAVLGSIYLARISRLLSWASWVFVVLIFNSTIYLGWHYLLDDVGSLLLVACSVWFARVFAWRWPGSSDAAVAVGTHSSVP